MGMLLWPAGSGFKVTDRQCNLVVGCKPTMTLDEIEHWIANRRKAR
jgi:hypothetical protein